MDGEKKEHPHTMQGNYQEFCGSESRCRILSDGRNKRSWRHTMPGEWTEQTLVAAYDAVGNIEILQADEYKPVHVRSIWVEDANSQPVAT